MQRVPSLAVPRPVLGRVPVPAWSDVAIAAAFLVMTLAEAVASSGVRSPGLHAVVGGAAMASLAWRRLFPLQVALVVIAANLFLNPDNQFATILSLVLISYTLGAELDAPRAYVGLATVVVPFVTVNVLAGLEPSDLAAALVFLGGPWGVGRAVRQRAATGAETIAAAERKAREREEQAAAAVAQERARIARELHDVVSHSISVVTIQTQAVRRRLGPENAREAADLARVEETAREALAEMRRLFGVLRSDGEAASLAPQPGLHELDRLVTSVRAAGLEVRVQVEGEPFDLSPGVDLAAYRVLQEGLTNALRHARAGRVDVLVGYAPDRLRLQVEDDGVGPEEDLGEGPGHGLVGIRERVALYGGTVQIERGSLGGVRLSATLPVQEAP